MAIKAEDSSMVLRIRDDQEKPWRDLIVWPFGESGVVEGYGSELAISFTADGGAIYIQSALNSNTTRLIKIDARTGKELEVIASHDRSNVWNMFDATLYPRAQALISPLNGKIQAVAFNYLKPEWKVVDPRLIHDFDFLQNDNRGFPHIVSRDSRDRVWIIGYVKDSEPMAYYYYDRSIQGIRPLFDPFTGIEGQHFAPVKPMILKARDNLEIPCYLTLPIGDQSQNLPLVLLIHGGPWSRDRWEFNPTVQWLANRGYAVLQVNYRGSEGFGKKHMNEGNGQWGIGTMQRDLTDAVKWTINEGIVNPKRVAIIGGSYGGYATLSGLAFTPDLYACGIDMFGMANLRTTFESFPDYWKPLKTRWIRRVGDVEKDDQLNRRISPFFHVRNIRAPLLIGHGANDPRVRIQESEEIVRALRKNNLPVTLVVYPDEGHGFVRHENILDFYGRVEEFLAKHLGGRYEPWKKIEGSSAMIC